MKNRLADKAYDLIQKKIITLEFKPGQQLDEKKLADQLRIGRTPIREALLKLTSEHMVDSQPQKGFVVTHITFQDVKVIFEALKSLEMCIAKLAVQKDVSELVGLMRRENNTFKNAMDNGDFKILFWSNDRFHLHFAACSKNSYLIRALKSVRNEVNRLTFLSFKAQFNNNDEFKAYNESVYAEHQQIINFLENKKINQLEKAIELHIQNFQQLIVSYLTT